jgi:hypothetical protein
VRKNFSVKDKRAGIKRANGHCEGCGLPFSAANPPECDHDKEDWEGGDASLENMKVLGKKCCHTDKSAAATGRRAKADMVRKKNVENIRPAPTFRRAAKPIRPDKTCGGKGHAAHQAAMAAKGKAVPINRLRAQAREYGQD